MRVSGGLSYRLIFFKVVVSNIFFDVHPENWGKITYSLETQSAILNQPPP